jgi:hypothetical protein
MADGKEEILLEIIVSNDAATQAIFESQKNIDKLKQSQAELTAEFKKGAITQEEYSKKSTATKVAISQQNDVIRANEKELKNNIKAQQDNGESLRAIKAQLSNNIAQWEKLTIAERESSKGKDLQNSITDTIGKLKEAEESTDRFQRSVGKYPEGMGNAGKGINQVTGFLGKMSDQVSVVSPKLGGMISQFGGFAAKAGNVSESVVDMSSNIAQSGEAINAVEGFAGKASGSLSDLSTTANVAGKTSTSAFSSIASGAKSLGAVFLAPPIILIAAIVGAIVGAFMLLKKGFELNDAASEKMEGSFATLQPVLDALGKVAVFFAEALAGVVSMLAEATTKTVDFVAGLFGIEAGFSKAAQEARNLKKAQNELDDAERNFTVNSAERQLKRSKLLAEVADKEKNNAAQRIAFLKDATELDRKELEEKKNNALQAYLLTVQQAKNESDTSDETADKIAAARVRILNANTEYFEGIKTINKKLSAAEEELANEQKARYEDWKKNKDDQIAKEKAYLRQLEDLVTDGIKNDLQRQIKAEELKTERANTDLKEKLKTEKNLTEESRSAINEIIILNEQNLKLKIAELNKKASDEEIKKQIDQQQQIISAKIELATKGTDDEFNLLVAKLELQKSTELANVELTNVERLAIIDKYDEQETALKEKYLADRYNKVQEFANKELELKLLKIEQDGLADEVANQAILDREIAKNEALKALDDETKNALYENQIDYEIALAESDQRIKDANQAVTDSQIRNAEIQANTVIDLGKSVSEFISAFNEDSAANADFARTIALVEIGIKTAVAVAKAIASAQDVPYPGNLVAAATGVAAVLSGIASAKKLIDQSNKKQKVPESKVQKLATGGLVRGAGSGTSDSIPAMLSDGESIINANSTAMFTPLLSSLNIAGGGVGFGNQQINNQLQGEEMLARAFAAGASMLPPPVLSLKEFHSADDRLTAIKELG